jgi:maltooligosyltrehalose trehalohydrolase
VHEFSVWAPAASRVEVVIGDGGDRLPMVSRPDGWWTREVATAGHGTDYAFFVDGAGPFPDPRSGWQPQGVHGPSRLFEPARHRWHDAGRAGRGVLGSVFYELHVGTFTAQGTLAAAEQRLQHLVDLGVDVVQLTPLAAMPGRRGWGYDGVGLYAVHEPYGGPAALQRFVDACHARDLAVCLDVVYNHLGPEGNYLSVFGPYFTGTHQTPWGPAINLDADGALQVRRWICDNALRWFEDFHLDALRLDAVHALVDHSDRHLLAQLSDETAVLAEKLDRPLGLIAESDLNDPTMIEPTAGGGYGMSAQWSDDFHHALHSALTGERQGYYEDFGSVQLIARTLTAVFRHAGEHSAFRGKVWGRRIDPARHAGHRFVGYLQSHDQVGNRAVGDRIGAEMSAGRQAAGAALVLASPFTPMLFMGEEWGAGTRWMFFSDFTDPELAEAAATGRRLEFSGHGWGDVAVPDPRDDASFSGSVLDWDEPSRPPHDRMLAWYRGLIALRRREPDLRDDDLRRVHVEHGDDWIVLHRGAITVLVNLGAAPAVLPADASADVLLGWGEAAPTDGGGWRLGPDAVAVLSSAA